MRNAFAILCCISTAWACDTVPPIWAVRSNDADPFYRIVENGRVGFIDGEGKIVIRPTLPDYVGGEFHDGLLVTGISDGAYISTSGKKVLDTGYYRNWDFSEGLAVAMPNHQGQWGYIDTSGKFAIAPQFNSSLQDYVWPFSNGFAKIKVQGRYGFIDHSGKFAIAPQYLDADDFEDDMAIVVVDGPCLLTTGDLCAPGKVIPPLSGRDTAPACKFAFADKAGHVISDSRYEAAKPFSEGLAPVRLGGKWGYIGKDGSMAIPPSFDEAMPFSGGLAAVSQGGLYGYIDKSGSIVIQPQFKQSSAFAQGLAYVGDRQSGFSVSLT